MTKSEVLSLKSSLAYAFHIIDGFAPGDEDVEYQMEKANQSIDNMVSYLDDIEEEARSYKKSLKEIESIIDKKIKNPYYQIRGI